MEAVETSPFAALSRIPGVRQLVLLAGLALAITAGVTAALYVREPSYSMLFSNVSEQEAGEIMDALNGTEIPHQIDPKTGAILVASDKLHEARLKLAAQGLPRGSGFGLEIMQESGTFGTSQFMENARYNHALETELARTISTLRPVQSARIHLALPESSVFLRKRREPSASVLVNLYPGRELEKSQVASIVHLVASSIPGLDSTRVTVVDQQGQLLNAPGDATALGLSTQQFEYAERIEKSYSERITTLLSPMLGPDRVRATVTAEMDFTEREETREDYDPDTTAVRSEQVAEDRHSDGASAAGGIPGALSNTPPPPVVANNAANPAPAAPPAPPAAAGAGTGPGAAQTTNQQASPVNESVRRTRNFEVDRTLSRTRQPTGTIRKLSVAVLVDQKHVTAEDGTTTAQPLAQQEIDNITRLVKEAVGFDEKRGDSVSVSNVSFYEKPVEETPEAPGFLESPGLFDTVRSVLAGLLVLALAFVVIRPIMRSLGAGLNGAGAPGGALPLGSGGATGSYGAAPRVALSFDDKISVARQLADKNPERVAQIVRTWMQTDE